MTFLNAVVLVTPGANGLFQAQVIDGPTATAIGATQKQAVEQIHRYLQWLVKQPGVPESSQLRDFTSQHTRVQIRLQHRNSMGRRQLTGPPIDLRVRTFLGKHADGTAECILPDFDARFVLEKQSDLKALIEETVRGAVIESWSPAEAIHWTSPHLGDLITLKVRTKQKPVAVEFGQMFPTLSGIATLVTKEKGEGLVLCRDSVIHRVMGHLTEGVSVLLLGRPGSGRSSVIRAAALTLQRQRREQGKKGGKTRETPTLWLTDANAIVSGMQYLGQWEQRLEAVISELSQGHGYLWVNSLIDLVRTGGQGPRDSIASFLLPYLERGEVRLIAEVSADELDACRRLLPGFAQIFQTVRLSSLSTRATQQILDEMLLRAGRDAHVEHETGVADLITRLYRQYMPYQALPRGPVHFVRDAVESLRNLQGADQRSLTREVVLQRFSAATGLPQWLIRDDEVLDQQHMRQRFEQQVRGQPLACQAACETINRFKAGMNDPQRPLRVMFFSGPTGVGKTQLAKSLGSILLSEREEKHQLIRLDMSEYAGFGAAERLLLDEHGEPSAWIRRVRQWPFGVLLLEEIEKADLRVFDILLGLLDEGRLTDRFGRTTSFASTVIIMTSNLGTRNQNALGFGSPTEAASGHIRREMSRMFRPEFLNLIDCIVPFSPISLQIAKEIAEKELQGLARREGFLQRNIRLTWSDDLVAHLAEVGFHPQYGARPLQRSVEQLVVAAVSRWLARQSGIEGFTLHLSWDGELVIRTQANQSFSAT